MITLRGTDLDMYYQLGDFNYNASWSATEAQLATLSNSHWKIKNVSLVLLIVQLSDEAQSLLDAAHSDHGASCGCKAFHETC